MEKKINSKYSVFGGTGFVGSNFCRKFNKNIILQTRDERIPKTNNILYLISTVHNFNIFEDIKLDVETNLSILCEVLDNCRDENIVFNFISSWFVYGDCALPATEETFCKPKGFYSITKKTAEDLLITFCETYNLKYRIIRLCNVLGGGDKKNSLKKNAITYMINLLKNNKDVFLYHNGNQLRDVMHVDDVCDAIQLICDKGNYNEIYNISSGKPTKIKEIIYLGRDLLNSNSIIINREVPRLNSASNIKDFWMDNSKLLKLGFKQNYSLQETIQDLCSNKYNSIFT
ncbi:NAD(P)-dependent oxidoreductase [Prochlorococcus marinus XMU1406]|uniref:NAD-dependent epimerase/dehydratase family protein n=1 Tax=Prochlorococcus marinus TaxID=1219 RepID=UPI001ADC6A70|nr:NAD(P)-dependent oxidoreductase [Prochlorococcus marinus]MBO8206825.1 NAD(P)-dependent oxidoreductase [Prochlorococcus marinus XMU1406]MCR8542644.1 NAD(P)-dependent oxidoreductase [Prochlorococcus marinus XMU1427]